MSEFVHISLNIVLPLFIPVVLGFIWGRIAKPDIEPLSALQFYILIPALLFTKVTEARLSGSYILMLIAFSCLLFLLLYLAGILYTRLIKADGDTGAAVINAVCFYNSGNYSLPLIDVLFKSDPTAVTAQAMIMLTQNILTGTFGVFTAARGDRSTRQAFTQVLKIPIIYAAAVAYLMKLAAVTPPESVQYYIGLIGGATVPVALITLGLSLARIKFDFSDVRMYVIICARLLVSPLIAIALVRLLGVSGVIAQVMVISSGAPVAVNALLLSIKYNNRPELVSKSIFASTILSAVTVSGLIYFALHVM